MRTFAVTINPSPYKKWANNTFVNEIYERYGRIQTKQYNKLPQDIQEQLLICILDYIVKHSFKGLEWSDYVFESTHLKNRHIHVFFKLTDQSQKMEDPNKNEIILKLNEQFGCCKAGHPAIYIEETRKDINFWKQYMKKDVYLETLMNVKIPPQDLL